jgi:type IV secretory pathway protease TraF
MKKHTLIILAVVAIVTTTYAVTIVKETGAGLFLGTSASQKVGFYGIAPLAQQTTVAAVTNGTSLADLITAVNGIRSNLVAVGLVK